MELAPLTVPLELASLELAQLVVAPELAPLVSPTGAPLTIFVGVSVNEHSFLEELRQHVLAVLVGQDDEVSLLGAADR